jgi:hypothetical protein
MTNNQGYYSSSKRNRGTSRAVFEKALLFLVVGLVLQLFLPWWVMLISCFFIALFTFDKQGNNFFAAFLGIFLLWFCFAFWIDFQNDQILSQRVIQLFPLPKSSFLLIFITGLVGGIAGGVAAMAGTQTGLLIFRNKRKD